MVWFGLASDTTEKGADLETPACAGNHRDVGEAVRRINADKRKYLRCFLDHHKGRRPGLAALTVDDFPVSRLRVVEPSPIPPDEIQRTYDWMRGRRMPAPDFDPDNLIAADCRQQAHAALGE